MEITKKIFSVILCLFATVCVSAGEWNDKPIICADEQETFRAIKDKKEDLIFKANQFTKVRNETGLAKRPVVVSIDMYVNPESGTFTIIEYHPTYE